MCRVDVPGRRTVTWVSTVFWRHQWHVVPSSESYTLRPTLYRTRAWSPSDIETSSALRLPRICADLRDALRAAARSSSLASSRP